MFTRRPPSATGKLVMTYISRPKILSRFTYRLNRHSYACNQLSKPLPRPTSFQVGRCAAPVVRVIRLPGIHHDSVCTLICGDSATVIVDTGTTWYQLNIEERIKANLEKNDAAPVTAVILTHRHYDTAAAAHHLSKSFDAPIMAHPDANVPLSANDQLTTWASRFDSDTPHMVAVPIQDGWNYNIGGSEIVVLHTPGHTSCHLSVHIPSQKLLIAGDLIPAAGHPSRWDLPTGNIIEMRESIQRILKLELGMLVTSRGDSIQGVVQIKTVLNQHRAFFEERIAEKGIAPQHWPKPAQTCMYWTPEPPWSNKVGDLSQKSTESNKDEYNEVVYSESANQQIAGPNRKSEDQYNGESE